MPRKLDILINVDGTVETDVSGCTGPECETITTQLNDALGTEISAEKKEDYWVVTDDIEITNYEN